MKRLKLKFIKITFENGVIKQFGDYTNIDHIETDTYAKVYRVQLIHSNLDNELQHIEIHKFDFDEIVSIEQRWL